MRTSLFGALFGEKGPRPSTEISAPSITVSDQLAALKGTLDLRESALVQAIEEQDILQDEKDSLRSVYVARTNEVIALKEEVDALKRRIVALKEEISRLQR